MGRPPKGPPIDIRRVPELPGVELHAGVDVVDRFEPHFHPEAHAGLVERGIRYLRHGERTETLSAGQLYFIPPGEVHAGWSDPPGWTFHVLFIEAPALSRLCEGGGPSFFAGESPAAEPFRQLVTAIEEPASALERTTLFALMVEAFRTHSTSTSPANPREAIQRARRYLESHFDRNVSLDELAAESGASRWQLLRGFRDDVGVPPHEFQTQLRVAKAKTLLASGATPGEAAAETGFADQSHLTRCFKRIVGFTPGHYARSGR